MLTVIVTITGRAICSANSYRDNNDNHGEVFLVVLTDTVTITGRYMCGLKVSVTIMEITGRYICSVVSYCDINGKIYV